VARKRRLTPPGQMAFDLVAPPPVPVAQVAPVVPPERAQLPAAAPWHPGRPGTEYMLYGEPWRLLRLGADGLVFQSAQRACEYTLLSVHRFLQLMQRACSPRIPVRLGGPYQVPCLDCCQPVDRPALRCRACAADRRAAT